MATTLPTAPKARHHLTLDERAELPATEVGDELDPRVDGIRRRSDAAFRAVYEATADGLASFAYGMLGNRAAAEDAVQQAFLELVNAGASIRGDGRALRVWLYRAVRFSCLDELRRRSRRPETPVERLPESMPNPEAEVGPDLQAALGKLSDRQRSLVMLRHVVGMSGGEIALVTKSNRSAVYAALGRAERRLRSLLDEGGEA
jgi:RNA polymerase sigma-70 factor (ECF subfamily)